MARTCLVWTLALFLASFLLLHDAHPHHHHPEVLFGGEPSSLFHGDVRKTLFLVFLSLASLLVYGMVASLNPVTVFFATNTENDDGSIFHPPDYLVRTLQRGILHSKAW